MATTVHAQWMTLQSALQAGEHPAVDAFFLVFDLLIQMSLEDRALADDLIETFPARSKAWPHARAIRLGVERARVDDRRWAGEADARLSIWRAGLSEVSALQSPALTSLYLALLAGLLLGSGLLVESLEVCERGLRSLQRGPHPGAEARLRSYTACGLSNLGHKREAIKLLLLAEEMLAARGMHSWRGRPINLGNLAYFIFELEDERVSEGGRCDVDRCNEAMAFARKAIDLIQAWPCDRYRELKVSVLHSLARLNSLVGHVDEARHYYQLIDEELKVAHSSLQRIVPTLASGRALIELALGQPERALLLLDEVRDDLVGKRIDWATLDWWKVRSELLVVLGRWREAHEAQRNYMSTWRAISRQRAEALAALAQRRLDTYNASALQFLSHDLRAPLGSIAALARASAEGGSPETMQRLTTLAERASHIAGRSIDYMRALLAEEADFQLLDLTTVLDDACEDTEALGADKFVTLRRDLRGPAWVMGDHDLLRRAFANLLTNAIRFAPDESAVSVSLTAWSSESWAVTVADEGPGFDSAQLDSLHAQTHASPSGHGLGLAFVSRAMCKHNATLRFLQNKPHGPLVRVQLHAVVTPAEGAAARAAAVLPNADLVQADSA
jgi:signal transduction histidine kinase